MKLSVFVLLLAVNLSFSPAFCEEPCEEFLNALRDRGYYDVALDYLSEMENSPLASEQFKATLPFEKALTMISSTARIRDLSVLEERLGQAESLLNESEAVAETPELKARSQDCRGDLLFRRARIYLNLADSERLTVSEKNEYLVKARGYLKNALAAYGTAKASYREVLDGFKRDLRDPESTSRLKQLRSTYTVVRVKLPQILEKFADTLDEDDPERLKSLEAAATEFEQLWVNYPKFRAGLDSCLFAARCRFKQKRYSESLSLLQDIFNLRDTSAVLPLKRQALALAADCWAATEPYPFDDVIANFEPYHARLTKRDQRNPDWQRIQLELAKAYHIKALTLKEENGDLGRIKNLERDASRLIKSIARLPGEQRLQARELMQQWDLSTELEADPDETPVRTFAEAKQKSLELVAELEALHADVIDLRRRKLPANGLNNQNKTDLEESEKRLATAANRCLAALERALVLADDDTTREDFNQIRYLQSICHYTLQRYYESSLIGEFLVSRYPTVPFSRQAGSIAVRSYAVLYDQADSETRQFERERLTTLARKMMDNWPGTAESSHAAGTLAKMILADKVVSRDDLASAQELIARVPDSSPERSGLNLRMGNKLWFAWRAERKQDGASTEQLAARLASAIEYLSAGLKSYDDTNLNLEAAWASLFLVEAWLESGDTDKAVKQLESAATSPIDLVKQKNPIVMQSENADLFVSETYKTAGKTYLAALRSNPNDKQWMDKATEIVSAMQSRADKQDDPAAKQAVVNMYRLVASQMEQQLSAIEDPDEQKNFADKLTRFLGTIQTESDDPNTIIWAGRTLMKLADSIAENAREADARPMYNMAISALERAASLGIDDQKLVFELKRQQAIAKRGLGRYEDAFQDFVELLNETPNAWQVQVDVANTLQIWGVRSQSRERLAQALMGTEKYRDPQSRRQKNRVWGWSRLADVLKSKPNLQDGYYRSLFGAVETRLEYGLIEQNPKAVASALKKLNLTKARDQQLGGPVWKSKFDKLEQRIRKNMTPGQVSGRSSTN